MFFPQEMTEIEMIVPSRDLLEVTKILGGRGIFQEVDSAYLSAAKGPGKDNTWQEKATGYAGLERRIQAIMAVLEIDEGRPPKGEFKSMVETESVRPLVEGIEKDVKQSTEQLSAEHKKQEQLEATIRQLEPVADIDLDISQLGHSRYLFSILGIMPVANMERLQTSLSRLPFVFLPLRQDQREAVVWLAGMRANADILERAARSAYLNPLSLPEGYAGTPAEVIKTLKTDVDTSQKATGGIKKALSKLHETHRKALQELLWQVRASRMMTDAIVRYGQLRYTYLVVGWIPSQDLESFKQRLKQVSKEALIEATPRKRAGDNHDVPTFLQNADPLKPFQSLVTTYSWPLYGEVDPTWLITFTFPLLFGAMFGDLGQGLVLAVLGWLMSTKRFMKSMAGLGGLITACGLVAAVFGILYGSVFGFETVLRPIWMRPTENIMTILVIAIGAGLVILSIGFLLGIYNAFRMQEWGRMIFDHNGIAGLTFYWSMLGLGGSIALKNFPVPTVVFIVLLIVSGIAIMFAEVFRHLMEGHRPLIEDGIGTYLIQAFFELFEAVITYVSNSLSYVRVGAFAVAHGGLSAAIFVLAALASPSHGIGYWVVIVIGNIFITGFEGLIVGIQTMRLHYYEFFSKFFTGGGARFEPLKLYPSKEE